MVLASTCNESDTFCQTEQNQLQAMENSGIKPTPLPNASTAGEQTKEQLSQNNTEPFKIPLPPYSTTDNNNAKSQDTKIKQDQQPNTLNPPSGNDTQVNIKPQAGAVQYR